jgi:hypothetical protein
MGKIGRLWDEGETFSTLPEYLHMQVVLGKMGGADNICEVRESFENLVKNIEKLDIKLDSIKTITSLESSLLQLDNNTHVGDFTNQYN